MAKADVHVAIALLFHQQKVLVGWREAKQHQGNKHEFPGGKVEKGETPAQACRREVYEEVGIDVVNWHAFDFIRHEYDDVIVHLHIFHAAVTAEQCAEIQTPWSWYTRPELLDLNFPKANRAMLQRLYWQPYIKVSAELGDIQHVSEQQLMYWRPAHVVEVSEVQSFSPKQRSQLILNVEIFKQLDNVQQAEIAAVHLKQQQLMNLQQGDLAVGIRYIAACHDQPSLLHAAAIGCDAVLLSPVQATVSHPEQQGLGWQQFQMLASQMHIPVFALGGLKPTDLTTAQQYNAYGVAGISAF